MAFIEEWLQRLDRALRTARPEFYERLLPGATGEELAALEEALGFAVPEDLKAFLRWKNGFDYRYQPAERTDCLTPRFLNMSSPEIIGLYKGELELHEKYLQSGDARLWSPEWLSWSPKWIPFLLDVAYTNVVTCYIDMGGAFGGKVGQILGHYGSQILIEHESFLKWIETVTVAYEEGVISFDEEDIDDSYFSYHDLVKELNPRYPIIKNRPDLLAQL